MRKFWVGIIVLLVVGILFAQDSFKYEAKGKRDPFVPLISEGGAYVSDADAISSVKDVRLEGIVWDEMGPIAVINGEIFKQGQQIGAVKILKIDKDSVVFDVDGEQVRVELSSD